MITISVRTHKEDKKNKKVITTTTIECYKSMDKAKSRIRPIVLEMKKAENEKRQPKEEIVGASYESKAELSLLVETGAIVAEALGVLE